MKIIRYYLNNLSNEGTEENPKWVDHLLEKSMPYSEANEEIAKKEAYKGEYTIEDDDQPEEEVLSQEDRIAQLEEALALLLSGVTE